MADWRSFNQNLGGISKGFGDLAREKLEMARAIELLKQKAAIEAQYNPDTQFMNWIMRGGGEGGGEQAIDTTGTDIGTGEVVGVGGGGMGLDRNQILRSFIRKKFGDTALPLSPEERQAEISLAAEKAGATEAAKPYSDIEAGVISKAELLGPKIQELIDLVENKKIYEGLRVPFGASRVASFLKKPSEGFWGGIGNIGLGINKGMTVGPGREAGLILNDIRILAFGEGGKALTPSEQEIVFSQLNPENKTEVQWIKSLKMAKAMLEKKAQLMSKKSASIDINLDKKINSLLDELEK